MPTLSNQPRTRKVKPATGTCSLRLTINGTRYKVNPIHPDAGSGVVRAFRLTKPDGTVYDIAQFASWRECSCPDYLFNRDGMTYGPCKHLAAATACCILD